MPYHKPMRSYEGGGLVKANLGTGARDKRAKTYSNRRIKRTVENEATALGRVSNTVRKYGNLLDATLFPGLGGAQAARDIETGQRRKKGK